MENFGGQKVKFEDYHAGYFPEEKTRLVGWMIKHSGGLVKNGRQAMYILFGLIIIIAVISLIIAFSAGETGGARPLPYEETYKSLQ